ncbi:MAG: chromosomal replication initiator DnaA [Cereibacter sphaeroides]|uniref:Chromosomal replication initiator DnaA n=1 Tax=Cereibacter sphaeroides TaxID=1063 RepID=A0A2W5SF44_CERSP|nr:MAG: chromosomal replication initiator DnaA [Cereibacter sphaeroides]
MIRQLAFELPLREALGREDFMISPANALALETLSDWRNWPGGRMLLIGPEGAGKTHLAHVWAADTQAIIVPGYGLATQNLPALAIKGAVIIEDADRIAATDQPALFHLHNMISERGGRLLLTARQPVRDWGLDLPDLISRMQAVAVTRLQPPDDALLSAVLVKLFTDRQIAISPALIPYLVSRMDRSFAAARALVARLDARALSQGRAITRGLAADILLDPDDTP